MLSRLSLVGLIILILGSVSLVLFTFLLPQLNIGLPLVAGAGRSVNKVRINSGDSQNINLGEITGGHVLWVSIRVTFILEDATDYDCTVTLLYDSENLRNQPISQPINYNEQPGRGYLQKTISTTIMPPASSTTFNLYLDIENDGDDIRVGDRLVLATYSLWATVLPVIIAIAGLVVTVVGVVTSRKPSVPKAKAVPGGWEPTLQWGGGAAKQPKMAIKSTAAQPKKAKKVVKKAAPGGAQQACKFCGKPVPTSAYFCPHCYGKLR